MYSIHLMESICIGTIYQFGPCDWNQLQQLVQQGQLTHQTYVWKQGMPQWQMAGEVMELAPLFQGSAPQMPPMPEI